MARVLDYIGVISVFFLAGFTWTRYYTDEIWLCVLSGAASSCVAVTLCRLIVKKRGEGAERKRVKAEEAKRLAAYLCFEPNNTRLIGNAYERLGYGVSFVDGGILAEKEEKQFISVSFGFAPVNADSIASAVRRSRGYDAQKTVVYACSADASAYDAADSVNTDISVCVIDDVANLLSDAEIYPSTEGYSYAERRQSLFSAALCRRRSRYYLWSALFLLLTSFIAIFPLYYIVSATVLIAFAMYARFNRRYNLPSA